MLHVEHSCEIPREEDVFFHPGRGPFRKIYDYFRMLIMASHKNPGARKYLGSTAFIMSEKRRQLRSYMHIIHPFSMFSYYWDFLMIVTMTIMMILLPYQASFEMISIPISWSYVKNFLLVLCIMDMVVKFQTGYMDEEEHKVVLEKRKIAKRYIIASTFIPDFLGSFPTDVFFITKWNELRVTRKVASLICVFRAASLSSHIVRMVHALDIPLALYEFCIVIYWLLISLHWQACCFFLLPVAVTSMGEPKPPRSSSWLMEQDLWHLPKPEQYLKAMLRAVTTFTKSGLLQSNISDMADLYLIIILQVVGIITPWILVGRVMQFFKGTNSSRLKYQATMAQLRQYMRHMHLPYHTQTRIIQYYEFHFQRRFFRESEIMHTLSSQMKHEISMHSCRKLVENVTFFNNLPLSLLGRIVGLLKSEIFLTNDVIVRANQPGDCMYFIATGTVAIYTNSGKEVCHLEDGAHFGEVALVMPNELRVASVVAVEVCELYRLNRADFARTIHPYPMLWERIKKIAIERHEKTMILNAQ
ncbi:potassium/sodium hyperpolarization-activated cyclic nucleotide-gated channel 2 [Lasioglossum baleicum]|uniref:potassium/sodium hyperpolarization-activated cyclic nucleotide-gated channel 2 n=1 Tax=Lasioglossum baleicum TaxID=434251 RepID=UPI003FCCE1DF